MKNHTATKAIIMAAGSGRRLSPVTDTIPKPLINVNGKVLIESLLEALVQNGIKDIYIVVGYLKEQFAYLPEKYNSVSITLLENPYYSTCNNISSLYVARSFLGNCIITDGDLLIHNPNILETNFEASGYCSTWADETTEWLKTIDDAGYVQSCGRNGGENGWQLYSVSFWTQEDGQRLCNHLEDIFERRKLKNLFWDDIPMFYFKDEYRLKIRQINPNDLTEIDNLQELIALDINYSKGAKNK